MKDLQFGQELFKLWAARVGMAKVRTFDGVPCPGTFDTLFDHGFVVDCVPCWGPSGGIKNWRGSEFAVIARTYADDEEIDNPPDGFRCYRLPKKLLGGMPGTPIAIVIECPTPAVAERLSFYGNLPAGCISFLVPERYRDSHRILLEQDDGFGGEVRGAFLELVQMSEDARCGLDGVQNSEIPRGCLERAPCKRSKRATAT
jgi:hypothetical protein